MSTAFACSRRWLASCAFLLALAAPAGAEADDWPQFRGPNRDGVWLETGIMKSFPADGLKVRWRQPINWGWASPVVAGGKVYITDSELTKPTAKERVHCFDEVTGRKLWMYAYESAYPEFAYVPGQGNGPVATPAVRDGRVYTVGCNGHVHCLDAATGAVVWEIDLGKKYEIRQMQCRGSPLIDGDRLIVFTGAKPGGCLIALDRNTGREIWKALDDPVSNSSPVIVQSGGQRQLIIWTDASVASLNPETGATWWREAVVTSNNDSIPAPALEKDMLLISGLMFRLSATQPTAAILWPQGGAPAKRILSNTSSPILRDGWIYSARSSGQLVCLRAETGEQAWKTDGITALRGGASINITPIPKDDPDAALLFTDEGNLIRARLTPEGYSEISRAHLIDPTTPFAGRNCAWAQPSFANRHVFVRSDKEILCASLAEEAP